MGSDEPGATAEVFTAVMRDGILWIAWVRGTSVSDADAIALVRRAEEISGGVGPPMLVELNAMVTLSRNALVRFATELNAAALALVGASAVDRVISEYFTGVHYPPYPTQYFPQRDEALQWLLNNAS